MALWANGNPAETASAPAPSGSFALHYERAVQSVPTPGFDDEPGAAGITGLQFPAEAPDPQQDRGRRPAAPAELRYTRAPAHPHGGRWISMAAATAVLIIAAAIAILALGHREPAGSRSPSAGQPAAQSRPATSPATATPVAGNSVVDVAPAAATAPHVSAAVSFLTRYFTAINSHDYGAYQRLFSASVRGQLSAAAFSSGYGSTQDSRAVLHSIKVPGRGRLVVLVTFSSHQRSAVSATHSACTTWTIALYLVRQGHNYVIESPPGGYQASSRSCA
jgi:hypothetical protein